MSNKSARERMIKIFGAKCFIEILHLRKFDKPIHYTSKGQRKRMEQLTYHHIIKKENNRTFNSRKWSIIISTKSRLVSSTIR